jgi:hypothetical protein
MPMTCKQTWGYFLFLAYYNFFKKNIGKITLFVHIMIEKRNIYSLLLLWIITTSKFFNWMSRREKREKKKTLKKHWKLRLQRNRYHIKDLDKINPTKKKRHQQWPEYASLVVKDKWATRHFWTTSVAHSVHYWWSFLVSLNSLPKIFLMIPMML